MNIWIVYTVDYSGVIGVYNAEYKAINKCSEDMYYTYVKAKMNEVVEYED